LVSNNPAKANRSTAKRLRNGPAWVDHEMIECSGERFEEGNIENLWTLNPQINRGVFSNGMFA
jgi:hypothetical protein